MGVRRHSQYLARASKSGISRIDKNFGAVPLDIFRPAMSLKSMDAFFPEGHAEPNSGSLLISIKLPVRPKDRLHCT
jgi:hypothetical protein